MTEIRRSRSGLLIPPLSSTAANASSARAINGAGVIAGWYRVPRRPGRRAFVFDQGCWNEVGLSGARDSGALAINASGVVVGQSEGPSVDDSGDPTRLAFWSDGTASHSLGTLPGYAHSVACAVNDRGVIAGWVYELGRDNRPSRRRAVTFATSGPVFEVGTLGGEASAAFALNEAGDVVGAAETAAGAEHAFLCQAGAMTDLETLGGQMSAAHDVNRRGQIVGGSDLAEQAQHRAFLWADGVMWNLGTLGGGYSEAFAINDAGTAVGCSETATGERHAFVVRDGVISDLGTCGGSYSAAYGINDNGEVVGEAQTGTGAIHAFCWRDGVMHDLGPPASAEA